MKFLLSLCMLILFNCKIFGLVYDCFPFWKEFEILKIRLEELYDEIDYFVLVEATQTFTGLPKPLYFAENTHLFEKYLDKIIHIVVDDFPPLTGNFDNDFWTKEIHQHNASLRGLTNCKDDDIIFLSDVDEVIRDETIQKVKDTLISKTKNLKKKHNREIEDFVVALDMPNFSCQLNRTATTRWTGPAKAVPYWVLKKVAPNDIHLLHQRRSDLHMVWDAGWHFNTMGSWEMAVEKWKCHNSALAHSETIDYDALKRSYNEFFERHRPIPVDERFPKYVRSNIEYYRSIGWIAEGF